MYTCLLVLGEFLFELYNSKHLFDRCFPKAGFLEVYITLQLLLFSNMQKKLFCYKVWSYNDVLFGCCQITFISYRIKGHKLDITFPVN